MPVTKVIYNSVSRKTENVIIDDSEISFVKDSFKILGNIPGNLLMVSNTANKKNVKAIKIEGREITLLDSMNCLVESHIIVPGHTLDHHVIIHNGYDFRGGTLTSSLCSRTPLLALQQYDTIIHNSNGSHTYTVHGVTRNDHSMIIYTNNKKSKDNAIEFILNKGRIILVSFNPDSLYPVIEK